MADVNGIEGQEPTAGTNGTGKQTRTKKIIRVDGTYPGDETFEITSMRVPGYVYGPIVRQAGDLSKHPGSVTDGALVMGAIANELRPQLWLAYADDADPQYQDWPTWYATQQTVTSSGSGAKVSDAVKTMTDLVGGPFADLIASMKTEGLDATAMRAKLMEALASAG